MPWVRFTDDYLFTPAARRGLWSKKYQAGTVELVTQQCADDARAKGKAVSWRKPKSATAGLSTRVKPKKTKAKPAASAPAPEAEPQPEPEADGDRGG